MVDENGDVNGVVGSIKGSENDVKDSGEVKKVRRSRVKEEVLIETLVTGLWVPYDGGETFATPDEARNWVKLNAHKHPDTAMRIIVVKYEGVPTVKTKQTVTL